MTGKNKIRIIQISGFMVFLVLSFVFKFESGMRVGTHFIEFLIDTLKIIPFAFMLIGLFEVWVPKETVEKHFGEGSGFMGYLWAILLAGTAVGGLYVAFPVAYALFRKNASLSIVFTYLGAAAITRIPLTVFEASFLGLKFTMIRLFVSLPLVIISSNLLGNYLTKHGYKMKSDGAG